jgi:Icc-related predicted phosphoesterase
MRLLLFSDLHCDLTTARRLAARSSEADVVIGAGDFGTARRGVETCIGALQSIDRPSVLVPGNSESVEELRAACRGWQQAHVLHGSAVEIGGTMFFGIGGGIPVTPFGSWSYDFTEDQARELLVACPAGCVLVSHSPPKGLVDVSSRGKSLGSVAIREVVDSKQPRLVACGHIHESAGQSTRCGMAVVVNAGPHGMLWDLERQEAICS